MIRGRSDGRSRHSSARGLHVALLAGAVFLAATACGSPRELMGFSDDTATLPELGASTPTQPTTTPSPPATPATPTTPATPATTDGDDSPVEQARRTPVAIGEVTASCQAPDSTTDDGTPVDFAPENVLADRETAWRCPAHTSDSRLVLSLQHHTEVVRVGLLGGYPKIDPSTGANRWRENHRIRRVRWTFDDGVAIEQRLDDERSIQMIDVDDDVDASVSTIELEILDTFEPGFPPSHHQRRDYVPVALVVIEGR